MQINLLPQRRDDTLTVIKNGDALTVNGAEFDFAELPDGATLPRKAIDSEWFAGGVQRIDGVLHVTLLLPHGSNAPVETRFPEPLVNVADGVVPLPPFDVVDEVAVEVEDD